MPQMNIKMRDAYVLGQGGEWRDFPSFFSLFFLSFFLFFSLFFSFFLGGSPETEKKNEKKGKSDAHSTLGIQGIRSGPLTYDSHFFPSNSNSYPRAVLE